MLTTAINMKILNVMQICDSNFPVGSFNHSFGMETYLRDGDIKDTKTLKIWLLSYLRYQFIYNDGFAIRIVFEKLKENKRDEIWKLDRKLTVQNTSKESRDGAKLVGQRMIKTYLELYDVPLLKEYEERIRKKISFGHPAIATAILLNYLEISLEDTILYYMYSTISTLIQNGVRAIPLGQKDGLILMQKFFPIFQKLLAEIMSLKDEDFGLTVPGLEISQINHEELIFRLFMS
ncbi:urease accessory protein UreF [Fusobacterium perfoetens]|nr:urease accessory protein UreF [Fusobacterium perfoetens]